MNANKYLDAKKKLHEELGDQYPMCRESLTVKFLKEFGGYIEGVNEDDYDDFDAFEEAYYSSERWVYFCKMSEALAEKADGEEAFKLAWDAYLDWVTENYFPEYGLFDNEHPGIIYAHTEDMDFFDKSIEEKCYQVKMEGVFGLITISDAISNLSFSEGHVSYTIDATWYLSSFENLLLLSYNLNNGINEEGIGWKVKNGRLSIAALFAIRRFKVSLSTLTSKALSQRRASSVAEVPDMAKSRIAAALIWVIFAPS